MEQCYQKDCSRCNHYLDSQSWEYGSHYYGYVYGGSFLCEECYNVVQYKDKLDENGWAQTSSLGPVDYYKHGDPDVSLFKNAMLCPPLVKDHYLNELKDKWWYIYGTSDMETFMYSRGDIKEDYDELRDECIYTFEPIIIISGKFTVLIKDLKWNETWSEGCGGVGESQPKIYLASNLPDLIKYGLTKKERKDWFNE